MSGIINKGSTCYVSSALQCLCSLGAFREYIIRGVREYACLVGRVKPELILELREIFTLLEKGDDISIDVTRFLGNVQERIPHMDIFQQNDVHEFITGFVDTLNKDICYSVDKTQTMVGDKSLQLYFAKEYSKIVDILHGRIQQEIRCGHCSYKHVNEEPFLFLEVPVADNWQDILELQEEVVPAEWKCSECGEQSESKKKRKIARFPPCLMICFKRFEYETRGLVKHKDKVDCPHHLNICHKKYALRAVASHFGGAKNGHYVASFRRGDEWMIADDEQVRCYKETTPNEFSEAYILFYEKT